MKVPTLLILFLVVASTRTNAAEESKDARSGKIETRDWTAIDTDRDHYISADEMARFLERT